MLGGGCWVLFGGVFNCLVVLYKIKSENDVLTLCTLYLL